MCLLKYCRTALQTVVSLLLFAWICRGPKAQNVKQRGVFQNSVSPGTLSDMHTNANTGHGSVYFSTWS